MSKDGVVTIHGREYKTVALRVSEFREKYPIDDGWGIRTYVDAKEEAVMVKAAIVNADNHCVAEGYAEEVRGSSQINRTSALENCETSAIGRALAAAGFGGSEYASANEVQNAIHQQSSPPAAKGKENPKETETHPPSRPLSIDLSEYSPLALPNTWPDAAKVDYSDIIKQGIEAYGETGFSERVVRLLTHGDFGTDKIAGINFKQDGHRLYDAITNMLRAHEEVKGE